MAGRWIVRWKVGKVCVRRNRWVIVSFSEKLLVLSMLCEKCGKDLSKLEA
jgi:hypothetical protein